MAIPTNTYTRYTADTNVKEDNLDKIINTTPYRTPLTSSAGRSTAFNTFHEWNRDSYRTPNKDNARLDGDVVSATAKTPPARLGNYCQIFRDDVRTSRRSDRVRKFGMKKASAYFVAKTAKELQTDLEAMALSVNVAVAGNNTTAPKSAGLGAMVYTNASFGSGGNVVAHTSGAATTARTAGTARAINAGTWIQNVMQSAATTSSVVPDTVYMAPQYKKDAALIAGIAANRVNHQRKARMNEGAVIMGVDVIESGFGQLALVPHYAMGAATMNHLLFVNHEAVSIAYLDGLQIEEMGKDHDGMTHMVLIDACVEALNEKACAVVHDLQAA